MGRWRYAGVMRYPDKVEEPTRDLLGHAIRGEWQDFANVAEDIGDQRLLECLSLRLRIADYIAINISGHTWPTRVDVREIARQSVTLSTMFGDEALDPREKKALVFTDSVQDAAHRAGFVESRSHTLTLRALLRHAVGEHPVALDSLVDQAIARAGDDQFRRYRIIPPDLVERAEFAPFWQRSRAHEVPVRVRARVRRRLLFDAVLEFGLQTPTSR